MSNIEHGDAISVIIVGGGITGLSVAWHLRRHGAIVTVIERGGLGSGMTSVQPGGLRCQWGSRVNCLLALESRKFYRDISGRLGVPVDGGFQECGYLFVAHTEAMRINLEANVALQNRLGVSSSLVTPHEAAKLVPGLDPATVVAAAFCSEDGYFDRPQAVVGGLITACANVGVVVEHGEATSIGRNGQGWTVELADGRTPCADAVVVATADETPVLLERLRVPVPIRREPRYLFYSDPIRERLLESLVVSSELHVAAKQLGDGSVLASDLLAGSDLNEREIDWRKRLRKNLIKLLPILNYVSFPTLVEGFYDLTPDRLAVVGQVPEHDDLWIAAGHSGRGFMMAPAIGRILAEALVTGTRDEALEALSPARFDGAGLIPEQQIV